MSDPALRELVARRYAEPGEVERFRARVDVGLRPWERRICERHLGPGARVLDVGCGAGREAFALAARGCHVVGIDTSAPLLEAARAHARGRSAAVELHPCDGRTLPFGAARFDHVAFWAQVLANVPGHAERVGLLAEARRVLRPDGRVSLSVHDRASTEQLARAQGLLHPDPAVRLEPGDFLMCDAPDSATPCYWHLFTRDELHALCAEAGLELLECARADAYGDPDRANLWICVARALPTRAPGR